MGNIMNQALNNRYKLIEIIGEGSFGTIVKVEDIQTRQLYACKIEKHPQKEVLVKKEFEILKLLEATHLFPKIHSYSESQRPVLIMELLRSNMEKEKSSRQRLSMRTVSLVGKQLFRILETLHKHGYVHRDLKPQNIMLSCTDPHKMFLIDYGLAKLCQKQTLPKTQNLVGNVRYASRFAHFGDSSRQGDLQSACYILIYLYMGYLPWQKLPLSAVQEELERVNSYEVQPTMTPLLRMKLQLGTSQFERLLGIESLWFQELVALTRHCQQIETQQLSQYSQIMRKMDRLMVISDANDNGCFDWCSQGCKAVTLQSFWEVVSDDIQQF